MAAVCGLLVLMTGCEEFAKELSPETLAAMQERTRRLSQIEAELASRGLKPRPGPPGVDEVRVQLSFPSEQPHLRVGLAQGGAKRMMFDTGASLTVLGPNEALKHGALFVSPHDVPEMPAQGVLGVEPFRPAVLPGVELGSWKVGPLPILVPAETARLGPGMRLYILGFDVVRRHCSYVTVDYQGKELVFGFRNPYQPSGRANVRQSSFRIDQGVPVTRLTSGNVSWDAILDTGSFNGVEISESVARAMGREKDGILVGGMRLGGVGGMKTSEEVGLRYLFLPELRVCGMTHRKAQVDIAPGMPRVGSFFFQDYKVTFDLRSQKLWLEW